MKRRKQYSYVNNFGRVCPSPTYNTIEKDGKTRRVFSFTLAIGEAKKVGDKWDNSNVAYIEHRAWDEHAEFAFEEIQVGSYVVMQGRECQDRFPQKCPHCNKALKTQYRNWDLVQDFHVVQGLKGKHNYKDEDLVMPGGE